MPFMVEPKKGLHGELKRKREEIIEPVAVTGKDIVMSESLKNLLLASLDGQSRPSQ